MLERLLSRFNQPVDEAPETEADRIARLAEEKKERIKFHREEVRNGPVKWKTRSPGRAAALDVKAEKSRVRKLNKRHRRSFLNERQRFAVLRGQLQAIGALPYEHGGKAAPWANQEAFVQLVTRFGERDEAGNLVISEGAADRAIGAAMNAYAEGRAA